MSDLTNNESLAQMQEVVLPQPDFVVGEHVGDADVGDVEEAVKAEEPSVSQIEQLIERELIDGEVFDGLDESQVETIFLDGNVLDELSTMDKEYLERFTNLKHLSLANTGLRSVRNMP